MKCNYCEMQKYKSIHKIQVKDNTIFIVGLQCLLDKYSRILNHFPLSFFLQILEAIDEPSGQRLEQPDCCPSPIYGLMRKCWQHNPDDRPTFSELLVQISTLKPERVQAQQDSSFLPGEKEYLHYRTGDVITVLDSK